MIQNIAWSTQLELNVPHNLLHTLRLCIIIQTVFQIQALKEDRVLNIVSLQTLKHRLIHKFVEFWSQNFLINLSLLQLFIQILNIISPFFKLIVKLLIFYKGILKLLFKFRFAFEWLLGLIWCARNVIAFLIFKHALKHCFNYK